MILISAAVFAILLGMDAACLVKWSYVQAGPSDYFAMWSFGQFLHNFRPGDIYHAGLLDAFQHAIRSFTGGYPFAYPPPYMLVIWPLGGLPYDAGRMIWTGGSLVLWIAAELAGRRVQWLDILLLIAPATTVNIHSGQNGFLTAAILVGGTRLLKRSPMIGGCVLALMAIKPQFSILVPVALLGTSNVRAVAGWMFGTVVLCLLSTILLGWEVWPAWLQALGQHASSFGNGLNTASLRPLMPTVFANLTLFGAPKLAGLYAQAFTTLAVAVSVWLCFRRAPPEIAGSVLQVAVLVAAPYCFVYDMPVLVSASLSWLRHLDKWGGVRINEGAIVLVVLFTPVLIVSALGNYLPISVVPCFLLLAAMARTILCRCASRDEIVRVAT